MMAGPDFFETKFTIRDVLSRTFLTFVPGGLADSFQKSWFALNTNMGYSIAIFDMKVDLESTMFHPRSLGSWLRPLSLNS